MKLGMVPFLLEKHETWRLHLETDGYQDAVSIGPEEWRNY
jgi:hypothetical protein